MRHLFQTVRRALAVSALAFLVSAPCSAQYYTGEVTMHPYLRGCPSGAFAARGQLLTINDHTALFSLLGTRYGGDGRRTFALPDLRGRYVAHNGAGLGLTPRPLGREFGHEYQIMRYGELAEHTHDFRASKAPAASRELIGNFMPANVPVRMFRASHGEAVDMSGTSIEHSGGDLPVELRQPALGVLHCVWNAGDYPTRN